jgi:hypothetical protein
MKMYLVNTARESFRKFLIFIKTGSGGELFIIVCQPSFLFIYYGTVTAIAKTTCKCTGYLVNNAEPACELQLLTTEPYGGAELHERAQLISPTVQV